VSAVDELIAFVRAALDEDERVALACPDKTWPQIGNGAGAEHIARWDPARVLAEVEAKRRILDEHDPSPTTKTCCPTCRDYDEPIQAPCPTVRLLAQPYADRPGWREEWRLDGGA
jgi:hypothetical protein